MSRKLRMASLCSGIECAQVALDYANVKDVETYSCEIDRKAIAVAKHNYPSTIHLGDVNNVSGQMLGHIDILTVSSPCQDLSVAGSKNGLATTDGIPILTYDKYQKYKSMGKKFRPSCVFWECIRIFNELKEINPNILFLFENVVNSKWEKIMSNAIGVKPLRINSSYYSPQNRDRYYWTNIPTSKITDQNIKLSDVIPNAVTGAGYRGKPLPDFDNLPKGRRYYQHLTLRKDGKANCITASPPTSPKRPGTSFYSDTKGNIKPLNITHLEQIQTLPIDYTNVNNLSTYDRHKLIGNGWTPKLISEVFFKNIPKVINRNLKSNFNYKS